MFKKKKSVDYGTLNIKVWVFAALMTFITYIDSQQAVVIHVQLQSEVSVEIYW
jgi:hypothetical protein